MGLAHSLRDRSALRVVAALLRRGMEESEAFTSVADELPVT